MKPDRISIPVSLPIGVARKIEYLVKKGEFQSKSEALRFGARLLIMLQDKSHKQAEDYAYEEVTLGLKRGLKNSNGISVSKKV